MAFPTIHGAVTTDTALTTTPSVNLPASMVNGSLCFLFITNGNTEAVADAMTGWSLLNAVSGTGHRSVYCRVVDGSEGSTKALGTMTSSRWSAVAFEVRGWYGGTLTDAVKIATPNTYTGAQGFPQASPTLDPDTWVTEDTLWLAAYMCDAVNVLTTAPSGFTEVASVWTLNTTGGCTSVYSLNDAVSSKTPGSWTCTNQRVSTIHTLAIRPSAAALVKKLKVAVEPAAASASGVEGVVFASSAGVAGAEIGEFTGKTFEALTEGAGSLERAILKVPVADFGGGSLNVNDTVAVCVRNATYTTGIIPATVIEE